VSVDRDPSRTGLGLTAAASLLGALGTLLAGAGIGILAVPLCVGGVYRSSRWVLAGGDATLVVGIVAAGVAEVPAAVILVAGAGAVLTWDVGDNAISLADHVRADGRTERVEIVHAATSTLVVGFVGGGAYGIFAVARGGQPSAALALLVVGAVIALAVIQ